MRSAVAAVAALAVAHSTLADSRIEKLERLAKRADTKTISLNLFQSDQNAYLANISVGTPPQTVTVQIDTGSSDLWVYAKNVKCEDQQGCIGPYFDSSASSSFNNIGPGLFNSSYGDGSTSNGDYITETVEIGGVSIKNVTLGLAHDAESELPFWGIMGIDFPTGEFITTADTEEALEYYNLPYWMTAEGLINEPVYSLYLNDINAGSGTLLFGGIDTDKYTGGLTVLSVTAAKTKTQGSLYEFYTAPLTAVGAVDSTGKYASFDSSELPYPVILDSGSTDTTLPQSLVADLYKQLGVNSEQGQAYVPCSMAQSDIKIAFQFGGNGGALIGVPMAEVVQTADPLDTRGKYCAFGISAGGEGNYILGDTFLRSAYVVFDPGNAQVALAQAKLNVTDSNIQALSAVATIPSTAIGTLAATVVGQGTGYGTGGIPGSTVAANQATAVATGEPSNIGGISTHRGGAVSTAAAAVSGSPNLSGGTSIAGIAGLASITAGASGGQAAAASSSKAAAGAISPPSLSSVLAVAGSGVVMMMAGLGGAAMIFTGL